MRRIRTLLFAVTVVLASGVVSSALAAEYCMVLGGQTWYYITVDPDGTIYGVSDPAEYRIVGSFKGGQGSFSLAYYDGAVRPVYHMWNVRDMTGAGRAYEVDGTVNRWNYTIAPCPNALDEDPQSAADFDVSTGLPF